VFTLDTSCVTGKALTGLLLPAFRFVSVPSRGNLWMQVASQYPRITSQVPPRSARVAWNEKDDRALADLLPRIVKISETILCELQSEPGFAELRPRQQARRFGERAGNGQLGSLLQLARLGRLDGRLARQILRTPDSLQAVVQKIEADH